MAGTSIVTPMGASSPPSSVAQADPKIKMATIGHALRMLP
jgi:hypothetical protein